jgi:hypothetical protein
VFLAPLIAAASDRAPGAPGAPLETARQYSPRAARFDGGRLLLGRSCCDANHGRRSSKDAQGPYHASYATATCDGVLSLLAAGLSKDAPRVRAARDWLLAHERLDHPEGIRRTRRRTGARPCTTTTSPCAAEAYAALGLQDRVKNSIASELTPKQRVDGSFKNEQNHLMKEDDRCSRRRSRWSRCRFSDA